MIKSKENCHLNHNVHDVIFVYLKYVRELEFEQKPDYQYLVGIFNDVLQDI